MSCSVSHAWFIYIALLNISVCFRAPSLKCVRIEHYTHYRSGEKLVEALMKLTLLEELEIHFKYNFVNDWNDNMLQSQETCSDVCFDLLPCVQRG